MTKERVVAWLDKQVEICKLIHEMDTMYLREDDSVPTYDAFTHAYSYGQDPAVAITNLEEVAEFVGVPVTYTKFPGEKYPTRANFVYNGVEFYSLLDREVVESE